MDANDIVTYYFIKVSDNLNTRIQAWTNDKELAKAYMDFHKCKQFKLVTVTDTMYNISRVLEDAQQDDIMISWINIKSSNPKPGKEIKSILIPITRTDLRFVHEEESSLCSTRIPYPEINKKMRYLKPKYQRALRGILLEDACNTVLAIKEPTAIIKSLMFDELKIMIMNFPDYFK